MSELCNREITVALFTVENAAPLLSPALAAARGTTGALALPVLLVKRLGSRFSSRGLFVVNAVAGSRSAKSHPRRSCSASSY
jgi:hypothetical protein